MTSHRSTAPLALWALIAGCSGLGAAPDLPRVVPNDNRVAAGSRHGDTLSLQLDVGMARWFPEADSGPHVDAAVFFERGRAPQVPGPLIRVPQGTIITVTLRNTLADSVVYWHGFATRPDAGRDSLPLEPGESRTLSYPAGAPGTYLYWANAGTVDWDIREREQLAGALVIDSTDAPPNDRIFVMNVWGEQTDSVSYPNALTINGRSWPHTERISATVGDSVRWRWINASARNHPMHLHGFYFRVDAKGDGFADTALVGSRSRFVVTETMTARQTMSVAWQPVRPGNWLFHCHIGFHVLPEGGSLVTAFDPMATLSHDAAQHMAGLILGLEVAPAAGSARATPPAARTLRLFVQESGPRGRAPRGMGYVLQAGSRAPAADSVEIPGPPLVLVRGEATDVQVINRLSQPTSVHWHGLELESYSDGVAGWSGTAARMAPAIAPADSFTAHLSLERAGTFIYHTHLGDFEQLTSGLYGPLIVLEPGQRFDPARDHIFIAGWDGPDDPAHLVVNGDSLPGDLVLARGRHRFRFLNIGVAGLVRFRLARDSTPARWKVIAKDGAAFTPAAIVEDSATTRLDVGETRDVEFAATSAGVWMLTIGTRHSVVSRRVVVR